MKLSIIFTLVALFASAMLGLTQGEAKIDQKQLREMLVQLGYEVKDLVTTPGKEKYTAKFNRDGLDIPIGYEISPSGSNIWLTVNLGDAPEETSAKNAALLLQNSKIQPSLFYVTETAKRLMVALAIENRGVSNALLRQRTEALIGNVTSTKAVWQK